MALGSKLTIFLTTLCIRSFFINDKQNAHYLKLLTAMKLTQGGLNGLVVVGVMSVISSCNRYF
jgi:hypothetical protein